MGEDAGGGGVGEGGINKTYASLGEFEAGLGNFVEQGEGGGKGRWV